MTAKYIPIATWAARRYDPPPSKHTLRMWCRTGRITPAPEIVGREYRVREDAVLLQPEKRHPRPPKITVLESDDPIVNDILNSGKTSKRRAA